jgi:hypothetical protein
MKTTEAKISKSEIDVFKSLTRRPDEVRGTDGELRKVAGKKKLKTKANSLADHPGVKAALRAAHGDAGVEWLEQSAGALNDHGALSGDAAFGPAGRNPTTPPPQATINQREFQRKKRLAQETRKGYAVGSDAGVDELRKAQRRPMTRDELFK